MTDAPTPTTGFAKSPGTADQHYFFPFPDNFQCAHKKKKVHFKLPMQELDEFMRLLGGSLLIAY